MKLSLYIYYIIFALPLFAQISPGDLTEAHKHLEGISNCTKCHELGDEVKNEKCLDCHEDIRTLIENNSGYHSSPDVRSEKCFDCHSEHHGRNFEIIHFDHDTFEHFKTGFELTGVHADIKCSDCHKAKYIQDEELKDEENTFLGLSQRCKSCHEDFHQGTLGDNCSDCHSTQTFIPAENFDHNNAKFKLTGAHEKVKCNNCHKIELRNNKSFQVFVGLKFDRCLDCHKDVHKGKFGRNCESCHTTISFMQIKNIDMFDHSKTNFPLIGQHRFVDCMECHKTSLRTKPKHDKCIDCHTDFHKGDFTEKGTIRDCSACHLEKGFFPSTYTLELHQKTDFPLTGSHLALPCSACHKIENKFRFRFRSRNCIECHENIHENKISEKFLNEEKCESCHNTILWSDISFDHDKTKFSLKGKHKEIKCSSCHFEKVNNKVEQLFKELTTNCESCHKDIHFNQFRINGVTDCSRCHNFSNWDPTNFDHSKTDFPLDGKHANVKCEKCHKEIETPVGKFVKYKLEETKCIDCHSS